ncbi:MAG: FAD-binding protein [Opitutales bacterium]|nr:FAD-binding protein [Opitutales bacterium]
MPLEVKEYKGKFLSRFRTLNRAKLYAEIRSPEDAIEAFALAEKLGAKPFVLGAGSNVFFRRSDISAFVMKNAVEKKIEPLGGDRFLVSSSVMMIDLLKFMRDESRAAPYYLASAPCEVGGAIAMNAGTGPKEGKAVFDFIESVKFVRGGKVLELPAAEIAHSHRSTELSSNAFALSAVFSFPKTELSSDPVKDRLEWAAKNQDLSVPNCGSLCNKYDARLMRFARFLFAPLPAGMSQKKLNWAYNKAESPACLRAFISTLTLLHKIFRKELKYEIKMID